MIHVNELVDLAQRLDSVLDDSEGEILSANFGQYGTEIHVDLPFFVNKFSHADIANGGSYDYPFQLQIQVEGILFYALVGREQMDVLNHYATNKWLERYCPVHMKTVCSGPNKKAHSHGSVNELAESM